MNSRDEAKAWEKWLECLMAQASEVWMPTFMFKEMHKDQKTTIAIMKREVGGFYTKFLTRFSRKPNGLAGFLTRPMLIGCPDYPVHKREKTGGRLSLTNGGLHFGSMLLIPTAALTISPRLKVPFDEHVEAKKLTYCGPNTAIDRIHVEKINRTPEKASRYLFKALSNSLIKSDDLLILPRSLSELSIKNAFFENITNNRDNCLR